MQFLKETEERIDGLKGSKTDDYEIKEILGNPTFRSPQFRCRDRFRCQDRDIMWRPPMIRSAVGSFMAVDVVAPEFSHAIEIHGQAWPRPSSTAFIRIACFAGTGSFGKVRLVRHKATGFVYAMKQLSKSVILRTKQLEHMMAEKNILAALRFPFIVQL